MWIQLCKIEWVTEISNWLKSGSFALMDETRRLLGEIGQLVQDNSILSTRASSRLADISHELRAAVEECQCSSRTDLAIVSRIDSSEKHISLLYKQGAVTDQATGDLSVSPSVTHHAFDYSIESLLNTNEVSRSYPETVKAFPKVSDRGERVCETSVISAVQQHLEPLRRDNCMKKQVEHVVMLPPNSAYAPGRQVCPMMCMSPAQIDQRIIENSVAWKFIRDFFGGNIKFPALLILIEEIRNVQMIPFKKCKNMRKSDLIKWLDDHWSLILPFFQALSPDEKERMWGYLNS